MRHMYPALAAVLTALIPAAACNQSEGPGGRVAGQSYDFGQGTLTTYAEVGADGVPVVIGLALSANALEGMPTAKSDQHHCFDRDADGVVDTESECFAAHEVVIPLPDAVATRADVPFKWVLFNWNPVGHIPPGVYDVPHFDVHFYIETIANVFALKDGPCGPEFVRCDQFERARRPMPAHFMHPDYQDVEAVAPAMGNHLFDLTGPEFNGEEWKRNWIFGVYDGEVTFYEEMLTLAYLRSQPDTCNPIKTPPAVGLAGYYPTQSCVRYDGNANEYSVSMEGFVYREASPPDAVGQQAGVTP